MPKKTEKKKKMDDENQNPQKSEGLQNWRRKRISLLLPKENELGKGVRRQMVGRSQRR